MQNVRSLGLALAAALFLSLSASAVKAQDAGNPPADPAARRAQFMDQMNKRTQDALGATDDEWKVLQPRIEKVRTLQQQARAGGGPGGMGRAGFGNNGGGNNGGGRRGRNNNNPDATAGGNANPPASQPSDRPQSAVAKASADLRTVLQNKDASPDDIKAKLDAFRKARDAAKVELAAAQKDLREIVNVRQEATLVNMGMLD